MTITLTDIEPVNSTSYADLLGVLLGLERLPGEATADYLDRLYRATHSSRGHEYAGVLNELSLQLGLDLGPLIRITGSESSQVSVSLDGIHLENATEDATLPLLTLDVDDAWSWRQLSQLVASINQLSTFSATLLAEDAPAVQLARQSNLVTVVAQPLEGQSIDLGRSGILVGLESFNTSVPGYTLSAEGTIRFNRPVPVGTQITYQYRVWPYDLIGSDVGLVGLLEPAIEQVAAGPNGRLAYNVREFVQSLMERDRSYWAR